jgi:peptide/nickel transport system permease protein
VIGLQIGALLAGAVITESIFGWGGVGSWLVSAIRTRDYITIQSAIMVIAGLFVLINLIVDLTYALLDPRIRYT